MSDAVIKSENIRLVEAAGRLSPAGFAKVSAGRGNGGRAAEKEEKARKAATLQAQMESRAKAAEKEAQARGFAEGMEKGAAAERAKLHDTFESLVDAFEELSRLKRGILEKSEQDILALALAIAEKILQQEVTVHVDAVAGMLRAVMKDILDREDLKIRLNPRDYHYLAEVNPGAVRTLEGLRNASLEADETVGPGGVIVETLFGEVDARIDRQLNEIREALLRNDDH